MADHTVALGVQVPDAMKSISGMLNFAGQAQNIQRGAVALEKERTLLPTDIAQRQAESKRAETGLQHDQFRLAGDQNSAAMQIAGGLYNDARIKGNDPAKAIEAIGEARDLMVQRGIPRSSAEWYAAQLTSKAHQPGAVYQALNNIIQTAAGSGTQAGVVNTPVSLVNTGSQFQPVQPQPGAPGGMQPGGAPLQVTLTPGSLETIEQDATGNKYVVSRTPQGSIVSTRPLGSGQPGPQGGQGGPSIAPNFQLPPGDREAIPALEAERTAARQFLASAPVAREANRGILNEIDKVTTGVAGPFLQRLFSGAGAKFDTPEQRASAYDLVGKYLERNAIEAAKSMGPHTNAGLESAIRANGSVQYNPTAIKKLTKLNDAIVVGGTMYQPGLELAIAADPQRGVLAKRDYDQAWAQNFDPLILQLHNAQQGGDTQEVGDITKALGGKDSPRAKEFVRKAKNLETLSTKGRLQ